MVSGVSYKFVSEPAFLHGANIRLQLAGHGSVMLNCRGSEIRRRHRSIVTCRGRREHSKKRNFDVSQTIFVKAADPGNMSSLSLASPASEMDTMDEHDAEFDADDDNELSLCRGLILDVSYRPINVVTWKRALCLDILEKAEVLEYYDEVIYSPNRMFFIPAVLRVHSFLHAPKHKEMRLTLNRRNIFLRDKYKCQYCNAHNDLTIDHVFASSRGGNWTWDNLVTACSTCNMKKASMTLEEAKMTLIKAPKEPKTLESFHIPPNYKTFKTLRNNIGTPPEWVAYLPRKVPQLQ